MNNSITKIWIIIIVLACTYGALIFWGIRSYNGSSTSIESIVAPDGDSKTINSLYKSIVQSDLHFNNFILTNDSTQWCYTQENVQKIDSLILQIEKSAEDNSWQNPSSFDTLKGILAEKARINSILMDLKKRQNSQFFTEQALNQIKSQLSDTASVDKAIVLKSDLITKRDTLKHLDIVKSPDDYKGFSGLMRKILGKPRAQIDTVVTFEERIKYGLDVSVDSSIVRDYYVDTTLAIVKNILVEVLNEEIRLQRELYVTELELISYNELLLRNIRQLLDEISFSNENALLAKQRVAKGELENANTQFLIIAGAGIFLGFVLLFILSKDITRTNLYRRKLEEEKERAEQLAAAKEIFLSKMSHEIRTPLHSISGFTHLLDKEILQNKHRKLLAGIGHANHYLNELISNILEQAKINAGTFKLETSNVYIPEICEEIENLFELRKKEQHNTFKINYADELKNCHVAIDPVKLKQVLINLLGNAFKYTSNGEVTLIFDLLAKDENYELKIQVIDTGTGIDTKDQKSIFQPFNQIPNAFVSNLNGTGLGLSISKHIVEHFGGEMHLESETGKGSTFTLHIPVSCEPSDSTPAIEANPEVHDIHYPINVLAVEDDKWNAYLLEGYLAPHLQELIVFDNAEEALEELHATPNHYNLLLTDLNLPNMSGRMFFEAAVEISRAPIIALSASLSKKDFDTLIRRGFADALGKPFNQKDLLDAIDKLFQSVSISEARNDQTTKFKIDWRGISGFIDGQSLELAEHYAKFTSTFNSKLEQFQKAIDTDLSELGRMAHQLKSNCEQIGITQLSERLQSIELFAELNNPNRAFEEAKAIIPELESIYNALLESIKTN
ncbi:MAG: ATP-binding protein [Cyclobacteriaceae bacterium]